MSYRITIDPIEVDTWDEADELLNLLDALGNVHGNATPIGDSPSTVKEVASGP